jgi:hypothetical protein
MKSAKKQWPVFMIQLQEDFKDFLKETCLKIGKHFTTFNYIVYGQGSDPGEMITDPDPTCPEIFQNHNHARDTSHM